MYNRVPTDQKFVEREGCLKKGLHPIGEDQANEFKSIMERYISKVELRGYQLFKVKYLSTKKLAVDASPKAVMI